jgi:hypothetical protein
MMWHDRARWRFLAPLLLTLVMSITFGRAQDAGLDTLNRATVFVMQVQSGSSGLEVMCMGSGTIIAADGLVLTNAHHVVPSSSCPGNDIVVAFSVDVGQPPIPRYRAEIAQFDESLDLAIIKITQNLDGRQLAEGALPALPFVSLGSGDLLALDDNIVLAGYPSLTDGFGQFVRGTISARLVDPISRQRVSWLKTNAVVPGLMTGGGVYDLQGNLVGVSTTSPGSSDCLRWQDANLDGLLTDEDRCIPIGGTVSAIRPIEFALPLIRSARLGLSHVTEMVETLPLEYVRPSFSRLLFAPGQADGYPTTVVGGLPSGTNSLFLFFDYQGMSANRVFELQVTLDGIPNPTFSLPPTAWSGGNAGLWFIGSIDQRWANGLYVFSLFIDGLLEASSSLRIGDDTAITAGFSNIAFGILGADGALTGNGFVLPTGDIINARFIYQDMQADSRWSAIWYWNNAEIPGARTSGVWTETGSGTYTTNLQIVGGVSPGRYRLELYVDDSLSSTADVVVAGAVGGGVPQVFINHRLVTDRDQTSDAPGGSERAIPSGASTLFNVFDWRSLAAGTNWEIVWLVDGNLLHDMRSSWRGESNGEGYSSALTGANGIPDGTYTVELRINTFLLSSFTLRVGIGQLPIDQTNLTGVQVSGTIVNWANGAPIPDANVIIISEDYAVADFVWSSDQIVTTAITDRNGYFRIGTLLQPDVPYSVLIVAHGFLPVSGDGYIVQLEDSPVHLRIEMVRG